MPKWNIDVSLQKAAKLLSVRPNSMLILPVLMGVPRLRAEHLAVSPEHAKHGFAEVWAISVGASLYYGHTIHSAYLRLVKHAKVVAKVKKRRRVKTKGQGRHSGEERRP